MTTRGITRSRLIGIGLLVSVAGAANAQLFTGASIDYLGVFGSSVQYSLNSGGSYSGDQLAGFIHWNPNNATAVTWLSNLGGRADGTLDTICGELVYLQDPQLVDGYLSNLYAGVGAADVARAGAVVGDNYNNGGVNSFFHARNTGNAVTASAFQGAVWAGRYGGGAALVDAGSTIQVGSFWIQDAGGVGGANWATFKTQMAGYYNSAFNHGFNNLALYLDGQPNGSTQDQFTVEDSSPPVPEPFTMALGAATLGMALKRRLRKNA